MTKTQESIHITKPLMTAAIAFFGGLLFGRFVLGPILIWMTH